MKIDMILRRLDEEQHKLAHEALQHPQGRDNFEYGRVAGLYAGIEHAKGVIIDMIAEREKKDFDL